MSVKLYPHQKKAVDELDKGKVLVGGVGSGKSLTSLVYFYTRVVDGIPGDFGSVKKPKDLYIFTTARKRDDLDWQREASKLGIFEDQESSSGGIKLTVDSYNNLPKYEDLEGAFIIFDEQRLVGSGSWVKSFLKLAKKNEWILLSATPGDKWEDYIPLFIANGFYKNRSEFKREHIVYSYYGSFPKVERYLNVGRLVKLRNSILVDMPMERHTKRHIVEIPVDYDEITYERVTKKRWNHIEERPIQDVSEMFALMRKVTNTHPSRIVKLEELIRKHDRVIVFYNFDYELEMLRSLGDSIGSEVQFAEWNGHKHEKVPTSQRWVYLVQFAAGAEAWNCITTDAMVFYSLTYSYRSFEQAQGRIDRMNTPFTNLYYYIFRSRSTIDQMILKCLRHKKTFNEKEQSKNFKL